MIECLYIENDSPCTTLDYENDPEKYRGMIYCPECKSKAWFIKGYSTERLNRMACFAARHSENCSLSTVLVAEDDDDELEPDSSSSNCDIRVDLDKSSNNSIYVSRDNHKHSTEESTWKTSSKKSLGNGDGFPLNKSLRQLLTNLCRNHEYAERNQVINIVADSGRNVLSGNLKDVLVKIEDVNPSYVGKDYIFWGVINNVNIDKNNVLWLNYGDWRKEPSIRFEPELAKKLQTNFKINDIYELNGADVIIVGHLGFSPNGKAIIQTGFTKYISFRRVELLTKRSN